MRVGWLDREVVGRTGEGGMTCLAMLSIYTEMKFPPPLMIPFPLMLTSQWALLASSLISCSLMTQTLLFAANLCPSPRLGTLSNRHAELAFAPAVLSSAYIFKRVCRSLLPSWNEPATPDTSIYHSFQPPRQRSRLGMGAPWHLVL